MDSKEEWKSEGFSGHSVAQCPFPLNLCWVDLLGAQCQWGRDGPGASWLGPGGRTAAKP